MATDDSPTYIIFGRNFIEKYLGPLKEIIDRKIAGSKIASATLQKPKMTSSTLNK